MCTEESICFILSISTLRVCFSFRLNEVTASTAATKMTMTDA